MNREDEKDREGVIRDENQDIRYDSGEAAKDEYEHADAYEKDKIELRGIMFFTLGLVLLIGVTFGLMALLQRAMEAQAHDEKDSVSPLAYTLEDRKNGVGLPPEPRLQAAPGFEVEREDGSKINLELREPQSEYRELRKQWNEVLEGNLIKSRNAEQANKAQNEVRNIPSYMSAGRASEIRRQ